jgi:hypothetical protein
MTSEVEQTGAGPADAAPLVGLVRVRSTSVLTLFGVSSEAMVQDAYVLVLPWKEGGTVVGLVLLLWGFMTGRIFRRRAGRPGVAPTASAALSDPASGDGARLPACGPRARVSTQLAQISFATSCRRTWAAARALRWGSRTSSA